MSKDFLTEGDVLMSTIYTPLMTIVRETPEPKGVHKVNQRMCNRRFYESFGLHGIDGCHEIISGVVAPYGIRPEDIPDTIDFFMNYHHDCASPFLGGGSADVQARRLCRTARRHRLPGCDLQLPGRPCQP